MTALSGEISGALNAVRWTKALPAHITGQAVAANHQGQVERAPYAAAIRTAGGIAACHWPGSVGEHSLDRLGPAA